MSAPMSQEPLRLTEEDLFAPKVDAFLDEQSMLSRALPEIENATVDPPRGLLELLLPQPGQRAGRVRGVDDLRAVHQRPGDRRELDRTPALSDGRGLRGAVPGRGGGDHVPQPAAGRDQSHFLARKHQLLVLRAKAFRGPVRLFSFAELDVRKRDRESMNALFAPGSQARR